MRFPLKEKTFEIRGESVTVREVTQDERATIQKMALDDKHKVPQLFAVMGCVSPKFTVEEIGSEPTAVIGQIAREVMILSEIIKENDEDDDAKEDASKNG